MKPRDELWEAIREADELPYGRLRNTRLEEVIAETDATGEEEIGAAARIVLMSSYCHGDEHPKLFTPFAWLLSRYDEKPPWMGDWERYNVLWAFKWVTVGMLRYPEVPRGRIEAGLTDMAERYAEAGEGDAPVLGCRFQVTAAMDGHERAHPGYLAWISAPRTQLSDCRACEQARWASHLAALSRHEDAVREALPVLDGTSTCSEQPQWAIAEVLASLMHVGQAERAAQEHLRGLRLIRSSPLGIMHARHLVLCARTGQLQRGRQLIEQWLPFDAAPTPDDELWLSASGARLLAELRDGEAERLLARARELAGRFDTRNGTTVVGDAVEEIMRAPRLGELPLGAFDRVVSRRRGHPGARPAGIVPGADEELAAAAELAAAGNVEELAARFDAAVARESEPARLAVVDAWRAARDLHPGLLDVAGSDAERALAVARLEGWLAIESVASGTGDVPDDPAAQRLRDAGQPVEALLQEQAWVMAATQAGRLPAADGVAEVARLTAKVLREGGPADAGIALARLVVARQAAEAEGPGLPAAQAPLGSELPDDPVKTGIKLLESLPPPESGHQQLRSLVRLLRVRAEQEPPEEAGATLRRAIGLLPDGVRPLERALARTDLAALTQQIDPETAITYWQDALADAERTGNGELIGRLLAAAGALRHSLGDAEGAVGDLGNAIPLLDGSMTPLLAMQARFDLSRALIDARRPVEAAEAAEATLADLTEMLAAEGIVALSSPASPDIDLAAELPTDAGLGRADVHLAGCAAFAAAEASSIIGETEHARAMAERSAAWHRHNGNLVAEAESWQLAAQCGGDAAIVAADLERAAALAEQAGDWSRAATCRRERAGVLQDVGGTPAVLAALEDAEARLRERARAPLGRRLAEADRETARQRLAWHLLAVAEQRARSLALAGRFAEALMVAESLDDEYQRLGDDWSARDSLGLRGQLRAELGDLDGAVADLLRATERAHEAGDAGQARVLAERLSALLADAGRAAEAEEIWSRYGS